MIERIHMVGGLLQRQDGRVLLQRLPIGGDAVWSGVWGFPGCVAGEDPDLDLQYHMSKKHQLEVDVGAEAWSSHINVPRPFKLTVLWMTQPKNNRRGYTRLRLGNALVIGWFTPREALTELRGHPYFATALRRSLELPTNFPGSGR